MYKVFMEKNNKMLLKDIKGLYTLRNIPCLQIKDLEKCPFFLSLWIQCNFNQKLEFLMESNKVILKLHKKTKGEEQARYFFFFFKIFLRKTQHGDLPHRF